MFHLIDHNKEKDSIKSFLVEFYESNDKYFPYKEQLAKLCEREQNKLFIILDNVHSFDKELAVSIESNCWRYQKKFYEAIDELISEKISFPTDPQRPYKIYFIGRSAAKISAIQKLRRSEIGQHSELKAEVLAVSIGRDSTKVATYTCDKCGTVTYQKVEDVVCLPRTLCRNTSCQLKGTSEAGKLNIDHRKNNYTVYQELKVQELKEHASKRIMVFCYRKNLEMVYPGDHVVISGVMLPWVTRGEFSDLPVTEWYFDAHTVEVISKDEFGEVIDTSEPTEAELNRLRDPEMYSILARSIAPDVFAHQDIKKTILLMLVKGASVNYGGIKTSGELNICLVGDQALGRLEMLGFVNSLCPRSQFGYRRTHSSINYTASVTQDPQTRKVMIEGGLLLLADGSVCCIDEIDSLDEIDQSYIHEVMDHRTMTIPEFDITMNARVSILATSNSVYNIYNTDRNLRENINLSVMLLSQFDIIWLIRDAEDHTTDMALAYRVLRSAEYLKMPELMRYLSIIQKQPDPTISSNLLDYITAAYVSLCREAIMTDEEDKVFSSSRNLQTIIRISTALARLHIRSEVEMSDVDEAVRLCESSKANVRLTDRE